MAGGVNKGHFKVAFALEGTVAPLRLSLPRPLRGAHEEQQRDGKAGQRHLRRSHEEPVALNSVPFPHPARLRGGRVAIALARGDGKPIPDRQAISLRIDPPGSRTWALRATASTPNAHPRGARRRRIGQRREESSADGRAPCSGEVERPVSGCAPSGLGRRYDDARRGASPPSGRRHHAALAADCSFLALTRVGRSLGGMIPSRRARRMPCLLLMLDGAFFASIFGALPEPAKLPPAWASGPLPPFGLGPGLRADGRSTDSRPSQ